MKRAGYQPGPPKQKAAQFNAEQPFFTFERLHAF